MIGLKWASLALFEMRISDVRYGYSSIPQFLDYSANSIKMDCIVRVFCVIAEYVLTFGLLMSYSQLFLFTM